MSVVLFGVVSLLDGWGQRKCLYYVCCYFLSGWPLYGSLTTPVLHSVHVQLESELTAVLRSSRRALSNGAGSRLCAGAMDISLGLVVGTCMT